MTDMTLTDALAEVKREAPWTPEYFAAGQQDGPALPVDHAIATVLNAAASGELIPATDARLAVALVVQKAAGFVDCGCDADSKSRAAAAEKPNGGPRWMACGEANCGAIDAAAILTLAATDALAEVQNMRTMLDRALEQNADLQAEVQALRAEKVE